MSTLEILAWIGLMTALLAAAVVGLGRLAEYLLDRYLPETEEPDDE
jgi:hypothetical protein